MARRCPGRRTSAAHQPTTWGASRSLLSRCDPLKRLLHPSAADNETTSQKAIGDVAKGVAAGFDLYNGIKTGGAKGGVEDAAGAMMIGAMIPGPVGAGFAAAGAALSLISAMFGDPKVARQNQINKELTELAFLPATSTVEIMDSSGELTNYDARGYSRFDGTGKVDRGILLLFAGRGSLCHFAGGLPENHEGRAGITAFGHSEQAKG